MNFHYVLIRHLPVRKVYRGVSNGLLPEAFWKPNQCMHTEARTLD